MDFGSSPFVHFRSLMRGGVARTASRAIVFDSRLLDGESQKIMLVRGGAESLQREVPRRMEVQERRMNSSDNNSFDKDK